MIYDGADEVLHENVEITTTTEFGRNRIECPRCGYTWTPRSPNTAAKLWVKCPSCFRTFKNPQHKKPILEAINEFFEKLKSDYPTYFNELERARVLTINIIKNGIDDSVFDQIITTIKNKKEYNFQT